MDEIERRAKEIKDQREARKYRNDWIWPDFFFAIFGLKRKDKARRK